MFVIIFVGQFQDRFTCFLRKPDDGFTDQIVGPVANAGQPGRLHFGQFFRSTFVEYHFHVGVFLQERSRHRGRNFTLDSLLNNAGLVLPPSHQVYGTGFKNTAYTHSNSAIGYIVFALEVLGGVVAGQVIEAHHAGGRGFPGAWLIKADMPGATDTK